MCHCRISHRTGHQIISRSGNDSIIATKIDLILNIILFQDICGVDETRDIVCSTYTFLTRSENKHFRRVFGYIFFDGSFKGWVHGFGMTIDLETCLYDFCLRHIFLVQMYNGQDTEKEDTEKEDLYEKTKWRWGWIIWIKSIR